MPVQEIKGEDYTVSYLEDPVRVKFAGELALAGPKAVSYTHLTLPTTSRV